MALLSKNLLVSFTLAISDFISFTISIYLALGVMMLTSNSGGGIVNEQIEGWLLLHFILALCCIAWYSMRLRHYFYRKTFWFELKEILRTLIIFAIIEIAVLAFTSWSFSRYLWVFTWALILFLGFVE